MIVERLMRLRGLNVNPLLLPVLLAQGWWVRLVTPRFPDADGPNEGVIPGAGPAFDLIVIGESTVAGIGAPTHDVALTGQTARSLAQQSGRAVHWLALGRSGANTRKVSTELTPLLAGRRADLVIIALGVNDTTGLNSPQGWAADLTLLIEQIRQQLGPVPVLLSGVPPMGNLLTFPRALRTFLGQRAHLLDQAAAQLARTVPQVSHVPGGMEIEKAHFCADGFHPSVAGYTAWGERLSAAVLHTQIVRLENL